MKKTIIIFIFCIILYSNIYSVYIAGSYDSGPGHGWDISTGSFDTAYSHHTFRKILIWGISKGDEFVICQDEFWNHKYAGNTWIPGNTLLDQVWSIPIGGANAQFNTILTFPIAETGYITITSKDRIDQGNSVEVFGVQYTSETPARIVDISDTGIVDPSGNLEVYITISDTLCKEEILYLNYTTSDFPYYDPVNGEQIYIKAQTADTSTDTLYWVQIPGLKDGDTLKYYAFITTREWTDDPGNSMNDPQMLVYYFTSVSDTGIFTERNITIDNQYETAMPTIAMIEFWPDAKSIWSNIDGNNDILEPQLNAKIEIRVTPIDPDTFNETDDYNIFVFYSRDEGNSWTSAPTEFYNYFSGDKTYYWKTELLLNTDFMTGDHVLFYIKGIDLNGDTLFDPPGAPSSYYEFTSVSETPIIEIVATAHKGSESVTIYSDYRVIYPVVTNDTNIIQFAVVQLGVAGNRMQFGNNSVINGDIHSNISTPDQGFDFPSSPAYSFDIRNTSRPDNKSSISRSSPKHVNDENNLAAQGCEWTFYQNVPLQSDPGWTADSFVGMMTEAPSNPGDYWIDSNNKLPTGGKIIRVEGNLKIVAGFNIQMATGGGLVDGAFVVVNGDFFSAPNVEMHVHQLDFFIVSPNRSMHWANPNIFEANQSIWYAHNINFYSNTSTFDINDGALIARNFIPGDNSYPTIIIKNHGNLHNINLPLKKLFENIVNQSKPLVDQIKMINYRVYNN